MWPSMGQIGRKFLIPGIATAAFCGFHRYLLFYYTFFAPGTEHPREDNRDLYYWAEITGQHTQTFSL